MGNQEPTLDRERSAERCCDRTEQQHAERCEMACKGAPVSVSRRISEPVAEAGRLRHLLQRVGRWPWEWCDDEGGGSKCGHRFG
jgi:hypothetical protein